MIAGVSACGRSDFFAAEKVTKKRGSSAPPGAGHFSLARKVTKSAPKPAVLESLFWGKGLGKIRWVVPCTIRCLSERRIDFPRPPGIGRPRLLSRRNLVRRSFIPRCVAGITARRKVVPPGRRRIAVSMQRWKTAYRSMEQESKLQFALPPKAIFLSLEV